jgi:hypothetical protein
VLFEKYSKIIPESCDPTVSSSRAVSPSRPLLPLSQVKRCFCFKALLAAYSFRVHFLRRFQLPSTSRHCGTTADKMAGHGRRNGHAVITLVALNEEFARRRSGGCPGGLSSCALLELQRTSSPGSSCLRDTHSATHRLRLDNVAVGMLKFTRRGGHKLQQKVYREISKGEPIRPILLIL